MSRIKIFELENHNLSKFKLSSYKKIPRISERTDLVCNNLYDIVDELKVLSSNLISSDFQRQAYEIINISSNLDQYLKSALTAIYNDVGERLYEIGRSDAAYAEELAECEKAFGDALAAIQGLKGIEKVGGSVAGESQTPEPEVPEEIEEFNPSDNLLDPNRGRSTSEGFRNDELPADLSDRLAYAMENDPYYKKYAEKLIADGVMDENGRLKDGYVPIITQTDFKNLKVPGGPEVSGAGCGLAAFCMIASENLGTLILPNMAVDILNDAGYTGSAIASSQAICDYLNIDGGFAQSTKEPYILEKLSSGYNIVVHAPSGGHFTSIVQTPEGKYTVKDSYNYNFTDYRSKMKKEYDTPKEIFDAINVQVGDLAYVRRNGNSN